MIQTILLINCRQLEKKEQYSVQYKPNLKALIGWTCNYGGDITLATWPPETQEQEEMENTMADLRRIYCKDGRWTEMNQERVQRQVFVYSLLNFQVLPPSSKKHFRQENIHES